MSPIERRVGMLITTSEAWSVAQRASIIEVGFGRGADFPQYAALHTDTGFLRLNYGRDSGWGTSIIVLPSFWEAGRYHQGAQISASWRAEDSDFVISFSGSISRLRVNGKVRLNPPRKNRICATITVNADGGVNLDRRPGEAFKPVALSSMHVADDLWDAASVQVGSKSFAIPSSGWVVQPPAPDDTFGLRGGSSTWKRNAPSLDIELDRRLEVTGWKSDSSNPDDDNFALWAASDRVLPFWIYSVTASSGEET